jgi:hypothetical protein
MEGRQGRELAGSSGGGAVKWVIRSSVVAALIVSSLPATAIADPPPDKSPQPAQPPPPAAHETAHELSAATVPQPTPPPSAVPAPTPEEIRHRRVTARIDSTRPDSVIERRTSVKEELGAFIVLPFRMTDSIWEQVCVTPCQADLDKFSTYRVRAQNGVSSSRPFTLPQGTDALHLRVDGGSLVAHRVGQGLSLIGISAAIVGASLLIAAPDFRHPSDARIAGGVTGGAGVAFAAVGIPLTFGTDSHVSSDEREVARVYNERGYKIPFLPDIKLSKTLTLTQRGIVF